jgi:DNA polymerase
MANLSKEEIRTLLQHELELLAAEGETSVIGGPIAKISPGESRGLGDGDGDPLEKELSRILSQCDGSAETKASAAATFTLPHGDKVSRWNALKEIVLNSLICREHLKPGAKIVFGVGNLDGEIFFCGEAPGAEEEQQGEPFVGRAGQLLTKIIEAMGLSRSAVYIGNVMNWRPEMPTAYGNRPPTQAEMELCLPYLRAQLEIVSPKVIVALGATAASGLLGHDPNRRMADVRGHWHEFDGIPLMVTYHPSYLLRNSSFGAKRIVWEDMLLVMERLSMAISEKQRSYFLP